MKYIILDVDNLAHRAWHALKTSYKDKKPVVFGVLRDLGILSKKLGSSKFLFCFDSPKCIRKTFYPPYKANHSDDGEKTHIKKEVNLLREEILPMLGYENIYQVFGAEADDLMAILCEDKSENDQYTLVSTDQDLYQLLRHGVVVYNPMTKLTITDKSVTTGIGVSGKELLIQLKCITGCKSDNISGVPGVGIVGAVSYLTNRLDKDSTKYKLIVNNEELIKRNRKLVELPCSDLLYPGKLEIKENPLAGRYNAWARTMTSLGYDSLCKDCP